jgi:hypothetical protein
MTAFGWVQSFFWSRQPDLQTPVPSPPIMVILENLSGSHSNGLAARILKISTPGPTASKMPLKMQPGMTTTVWCNHLFVNTVLSELMNYPGVSVPKIGASNAHKEPQQSSKHTLTTCHQKT